MVFKHHKRFATRGFPELAFLLKLKRVRERRAVARQLRLFFKRLVSRGLYMKAFGISQTFCYLVKRQFRVRPFGIFRSLLRSLLPAVQLRAFRKSGTTHLLPFLFRSQTRPISLAVSWFLDSARDRTSLSRPARGFENFAAKLFCELQDVRMFRGGSFTKRQAWHALAARNNAIRYFARRKFGPGRRFVAGSNTVFDNQLAVSQVLKERAFQDFAFLGLWLKFFSIRLHSLLNKVSCQYRNLQRFFVFSRWSFYHNQYFYFKFICNRSFAYFWLTLGRAIRVFFIRRGTLNSGTAKFMVRYIAYLCLDLKRLLWDWVYCNLTRVGFFNSKGKFKQLFAFLGRKFVREFALLWTGHLFRKKPVLDFRTIYSRFKVHSLRINSFQYGLSNRAINSYHFRPLYESMGSLMGVGSDLSDLKSKDVLIGFFRSNNCLSDVGVVKSALASNLVIEPAFRRFVKYNRLKVIISDNDSQPLVKSHFYPVSGLCDFSDRKVSHIQPFSLFQNAFLRYTTSYLMDYNSLFLKDSFKRLVRIYLRYVEDKSRFYSPKRFAIFKKVKEALRGTFYPYRFHIKTEPYFGFWIPSFNLYLRRFVSYFKLHAGSLHLKPVCRPLSVFDKRKGRTRFVLSYSFFHSLVLPLCSFLEFIPDWRLRAEMGTYFSSNFFLWYKGLLKFKLLPYWDKCKLLQRYALMRRFKSGPQFFKRSFYLLRLLKKLQKRLLRTSGRSSESKRLLRFLNVPIFPLRKAHYTIPFPHTAFSRLEFNGYLSPRLVSYIFPRPRWSKGVLFSTRLAFKKNFELR